MIDTDSTESHSTNNVIVRYKAYRQQGPNEHDDYRAVRVDLQSVRILGLWIQRGHAFSRKVNKRNWDHILNSSSCVAYLNVILSRQKF